MARLLLVRHGTTEFNSTRRFAGYTDIALSDIGLRQVERLRERLTGEKITVAYSSDLKRAVTTAEAILTGHNGCDIVRCPELREVNYGEVEGLTFQEIRSRYPQLAESVVDFNPGLLKFPGGETFLEFMDRTAKFLTRLNNHAPSDTVLVVSHSGPLRVLVLDLLRFERSAWWQLRIDNASLSIVETFARGAILNLLNDTSHLRETR